MYLAIARDFKIPIYVNNTYIFQNLSGSIVSIVQIISLATSPNHRTAAIYYFITALFILLACFDSYFALPLNVSYIYSITYYESKKRYICLLYLPFRNSTGTMNTSTTKT